MDPLVYVYLENITLDILVIDIVPVSRTPNRSYRRPKPNVHIHLL